MDSSEIKERVRKEYDEFAERYAIANFDSPLQYQLSEFCSLLKKGAKILDAGCGPARDVEYLNEEGFDAFGIDFSKEMVRIGKNLVPKCNIEIADFLEKEFKEESFGGIWCNASLIHIPKEEVKGALLKFYKWLEHDGILFLSMIEGKGHKEIRIKRFYQNPLPVFFYELDELMGLLEEAGFEIIKHHREYDFENHWIDFFCKKP
ncbi:MAG: hypothetical protein PWQ87_396 [Candidatus Woesearchaeota archaeon]|nr:hypothetical protein [Candidatus Woesearchaeota archaeon]